MEAGLIITATKGGYGRLVSINHEPYGREFTAADIRGQFHCMPYIGSSFYCLYFTATARVFSLYYLIDDGRGNGLLSIAVALPANHMLTGVSECALLEEIRQAFVSNYMTVLPGVIDAGAIESPVPFKAILDKYPLQAGRTRRFSPSPQNNRFALVRYASQADIETYLGGNGCIRPEYGPFQSVYFASTALDFSKADSMLLAISLLERAKYSILFNGEEIFRDRTSGDQVEINKSHSPVYQPFVFSGTVGELMEKYGCDEIENQIAIVHPWRPVQSTVNFRFVRMPDHMPLDFAQVKQLGLFAEDSVTHTPKPILDSPQLQFSGEEIFRDWTVRCQAGAAKVVMQSFRPGQGGEVTVPVTWMVKVSFNFLKSPKHKTIRFINKLNRTQRGPYDVTDFYSTELDGEIGHWSCMIESKVYEPKTINDLLPDNEIILTERQMTSRQPLGAPSASASEFPQVTVRFSGAGDFEQKLRAKGVQITYGLITHPVLCYDKETTITFEKAGNKYEIDLSFELDGFKPVTKEKIPLKRGSYPAPVDVRFEPTFWRKSASFIRFLLVALLVLGLGVLIGYFFFGVGGRGSGIEGNKGDATNTEQLIDSNTMEGGIGQTGDTQLGTGDSTEGISSGDSTGTPSSEDKPDAVTPSPEIKAQYKVHFEKIASIEVTKNDVQEVEKWMTKNQKYSGSFSDWTVLKDRLKSLKDLFDLLGIKKSEVVKLEAFIKEKGNKLSADQKTRCEIVYKDAVNQDTQERLINAYEANHHKFTTISDIGKTVYFFNQ